jgi:hypothetical protein
MAAPKNNKNAEKWTLEDAEKFMNECIKLSENESYDFIGEVAFDKKQDKGVFDYLVNKFPELERLKERIKCNCEVNCFRNSKKGKIKEATAIVNLKSNHGWTDRQTTDGNLNVNLDIEPIEWFKTDEDK